MGANGNRVAQGNGWVGLGLRAAQAAARAAHKARERGVPVPDALDGPQQAKAAITVNRPRDEVYAFWRELANLPRFMTHLEAVELREGRRSHWRAAAPGGGSVEWEAEIVDERPNELLTWASLPGADVDNSGSVRFADAPGGRGTEIHVTMTYSAPGGVLGAAVAKLFGEEPQQQVKDDLRRAKQILETGEIVRSDGAPDGIHAAKQLRNRPAQPQEAAA